MCEEEECLARNNGTRGNETLARVRPIFARIVRACTWIGASRRAICIYIYYDLLKLEKTIDSCVHTCVTNEPVVAPRRLQRPTRETDDKYVHTRHRVVRTRSSHDVVTDIDVVFGTVSK